MQNFTSHCHWIARSRRDQTRVKPTESRDEVKNFSHSSEFRGNCAISLVQEDSNKRYVTYIRRRRWNSINQSFRFLHAAATKLRASSVTMTLGKSKKDRKVVSTLSRHNANCDVLVLLSRQLDAIVSSLAFNSFVPDLKLELCCGRQRATTTAEEFKSLLCGNMKLILDQGDWSSLMKDVSRDKSETESERETTLRRLKWKMWKMEKWNFVRQSCDTRRLVI